MIKRALGFAFFLLLEFSGLIAQDRPTLIEPIDGLSQNSETDGRMAFRHRGSVLAFSAIPGTSRFFSAGKDGFISVHSPDGEDEAWQISDIPVRKISVSPDGNLVAAYESDGFSVHRVSVWDWKAKTRLYAKRFRDSIVSLSWSAKGSFLMIGNTSLDGIAILDGREGTIHPVFASAPGIVSIGVTGASESSMITFGPSGRILYTDVATGAERASYAGPEDIENPVLLGNNTRIAGYSNGYMTLIDATSGKKVAEWPSGKAIMATRSTDIEPVWIEETADGAWALRKGAQASESFTLPTPERVTAAFSTDVNIVLGTESGRLYAILAATASGAVPAINEMTNREARAIDDLVSDGTRLFLLSAGSLFISSGPGRAPVFAFDGIQANRLAILNGELLCWSTDKDEPLITIGFDGERRATIYQPKEGIRSLAIEGSLISLVEGSSKAIVIDASSPSPANAPRFTYSGAGLQDAILLGKNRLIISRSSTMRAPTPIVLVNIDTGETVPLKIDGDLCYGLRKTSPTEDRLAGFIVKAGQTASTELVTLSVSPDAQSSMSMHVEALYSDEDLAATLAGDSGRILTNLGKNAMAGIDPSGEQIRYPRAHSLPVRIATMDQYIVTLNYDGSLTWFSRLDDAITSSLITDNGLWIERQ